MIFVFSYLGGIIIGLFLGTTIICLIFHYYHKLSFSDMIDAYCKSTRYKKRGKK